MNEKEKTLRDLSVVRQFTKTLVKLDLCDNSLLQYLSARVFQLEIEKLMELYSSVELKV